MYFSDITNPEIVKFHKQVKNNFSMALTNVLTSDLFKIETIITDKIYKIYPLFYCENITSTNPNDEIMENKCVICQKDSHTRLYFNTPNKVSGEVMCTTSISSNIINGKIYVGSSNFLFICFDKYTRALVEGVKITAELTDSDGVTWFDEGYSNKDGLCYLPEMMKTTAYYYVSGTITMTYNDETTTLWEVE